MYNHQRLYVNQIIYNYWIRMQAGIVEKILRSGKPVNLTGDGQFDSPGFSARFLFYTMIDSTTKLVVDFYVAEKTMVSDKLILTSVARSPQAFTADLTKNHERLRTLHGCQIFCFHSRFHGHNAATSLPFL